MNGFVNKKKIFFLLSPFFLFFVGCGQETESQKEALAIETYEYSDAADFFENDTFSVEQVSIVHVRDNRIEFLSKEDGSVLYSIVSDNPQQLLWQKEATTLFWVEHASFGKEGENPKRYVIRRFDTKTGEIESLHWSKSAMTDLALSFDGQYLSFAQQQAVYALFIEKDEIHRLAGFAETVQWAPQSSALLVSAPKRTEYIMLDDEGIVSRIELAQKYRFAGAAFIDEKTIVGLQWAPKKVMLQTIDLRNSQPTIHTTWSSDPTDAANNYYTMHVSPSGTHVLVEQVAPDSQYAILSLWDRNKNSIELLDMIQAGQVLSWISDTTFLYTTPSLDESFRGRVTVQSYQFDTQTIQTRAKNVDLPISIEYSL